MSDSQASKDWAGVEIQPYSKKHFTIMESSADDHARFLSLVGRGPHAKGCHEWGGKRNHRGYGICTIKSVSILAHRLSYFIHNKKLSPELQVCHTCDNPPCVNPDHLFEGTAQDNARDRVKKGRHESKLRTHCPHGHEYTPENTRPHGRYKTQRQCITCQKESAAKSRRKKQFMEDELKAKLAEAEKTIAELRAVKAVPPEARAVEAAAWTMEEKSCLDHNGYPSGAFVYNYSDANGNVLGSFAPSSYRYAVDANFEDSVIKGRETANRILRAINSDRGSDIQCPTPASFNPERVRERIERTMAKDITNDEMAEQLYEIVDMEVQNCAAIIQRTCFPPGEGEEWAKENRRKQNRSPEGFGQLIVDRSKTTEHEKPI